MREGVLPIVGSPPTKSFRKIYIISAEVVEKALPNRSKNYEVLKMGQNMLIEKITVPANLRKRTTLAAAIYYDTVEIYENRVVGYSDYQQMTWYYKDYNNIDVVKANMNSQFAQVVFLTGMNSKNRFVGIDFRNVQNQNAMNDTNRLIFCSGMFSWGEANDFAASLGAKIRKAMDAYKNNPEEEETQGIMFSGADEIKKYKELMDMSIISPDEFEAKKKQILGL